jgi:hypothetical protein
MEKVLFWSVKIWKYLIVFEQFKFGNDLNRLSPAAHHCGSGPLIGDPASPILRDRAPPTGRGLLPTVLSNRHHAAPPPPPAAWPPSTPFLCSPPCPFKTVLSHRHHAPFSPILLLIGRMSTTSFPPPLSSASCPCTTPPFRTLAAPKLPRALPPTAEPWWAPLGYRFPPFFQHVSPPPHIYLL